MHDQTKTSFSNTGYVHKFILNFILTGINTLLKLSLYFCFCKIMGCINCTFSHREIVQGGSKTNRSVDLQRTVHN